MPKLSHERLLEVLDYDPATGVFVWKKRLTNRVRVGDVAGSKHTQGYLTTSIDGEKFFLHRLAWFYIHRMWPPDQLDHVNHHRMDNRIENLVLATNSSNGVNQSLSSSNTSGANGVRLHTPSGLWQARIFRNGREKHLGLFNSFEEAVKARRCADSAFDFHANHGAPAGAC